MGVHYLNDKGNSKPTVENGEEPPYDGDMEARVVKLEAFADEAKDRLTRIESKLDHVATEVGQFKWWLVGAMLTIIVTVLGTSIAIQQMTVATFQAAAQQASPPPQQQQPIIINVPPSPAAAVAPAPAPTGKRS